MPAETEAIRAILLAQHAELRVRVERCGRLAHRLDAGEPVATSFAAELTELRALFVKHNETEVRLLEPLLAADPAWGAMRIDDMLEQHADEHGAFFAQLDHTTRDIAHEFEDFARRLDRHMVAEERTFLSARVLSRGP